MFILLFDALQKNNITSIVVLDSLLLAGIRSMLFPKIRSSVFIEPFFVAVLDRLSCLPNLSRTLAYCLQKSFPLAVSVIFPSEFPVRAQGPS